MRVSAKPFNVKQLGSDLKCVVDRYGKTNALGTGAHGNVYAYHFTVDVEQRPAGISGIDAGVGLNQVVVGLGVAHLNVATEGADDATGHGLFIAERVAQGDHRLANHKVCGGP